MYNKIGFLLTFFKHLYLRLTHFNLAPPPFNLIFFKFPLNILKSLSFCQFHFNVNVSIFVIIL